MAVTKIWTIHEGSNIKQVIDYVADEGKTVLNIKVETDEKYAMTERQHFQDVIDYTMKEHEKEVEDAEGIFDMASDGGKTEERKFVSGINCSPEFARDQMMLTKTHYHKETGILLWHGYQSFKPGEVTAEEAHEMGLMLARNLWGEDYEILVTTHLDKAHIHNHFVINSVSWRTGKKLDVRWKDMARESDLICRMYGKSIVENPKQKGKHYAEYKAQKEGRGTWTSAIRQDIDEAVVESRNITEFLKNLKERGYRIKEDRKYFTLLPPGKERFVRIDRHLGEAYSLSGIDARIRENVQEGGYRMPEAKTYRHAQAGRPVYAIKGCKALYVRYSYMLGLYPKKPMSAKQVAYLYREELMNLRKIRRETQFLIERNIETLAELGDAEAELKADLTAYGKERKYVNAKLKTAQGSEKEMLLEKREQINGRMKDVRKKLFYCKDIRENSGHLKEKLGRELERGGVEHEQREERKH